jgi:acetyl-CoA synthetase
MGLPGWFEEDRWVPPPGSLEKTRTWELMQRHRIDTFEELLARSLDPEWFYPAVIEHLGLEWPVPFEAVLDTSEGVPWTRWFVGGRTNLTYLAVDRWAEGGHGDQPALIWDGEDGSSRVLSFGELAGQVSRVASGMRQRGISEGDVVAIYMPMVPEAVVAILAAVRMGAIAAPAFSGFGAEALAERLQIGETKAVVCADGQLRAGRQVPMKRVVDAAVEMSPSVETVIVVPRLGTEVPMSPGRDVWWAEIAAADEMADLPLFMPETPCLLAFTSGSSGRPKGAVHCHGRLPYRLPIEMAYNFDVRPGDRALWVSDMGWIMGPGILVGALTVGAAFVMVEGAFDHPFPDRLWQVVSQHEVTQLGVAPTIIRVLDGHGAHWVEPYELSSLRALGSTGEPMTPATWRWLHRHVGRGIRPIINISGGTEVGGAILSGNPIVPMPECRFAGPSLGIAAEVFDDRGEPVTEKLGELVVTKPWPAMTWGFWGEPQRYLETYWSRWENVWLHGDRAIRHPDGTWELPGRSDDLIKVAGKRIGPVEYESLATEVEGVLAAAAVGIPHPVKGEVAAVVLLPAPGSTADPEELEDRVRSHITASLGKAMSPYAVVAVPDIPLTRSGKVHRRVVRGWMSGVDPGDLSNLENPESRQAIEAAAARLKLGASEEETP